MRKEQLGGTLFETESETPSHNSEPETLRTHPVGTQGLRNKMERAESEVAKDIFDGDHLKVEVLRGLHNPDLKERKKYLEQFDGAHHELIMRHLFVQKCKVCRERSRVQ